MGNSGISAHRKTVMLYGLAMIISLIGLGDSIYLTVQHLTGQSVRCTVSSGCSEVLSSSYATIAGIPTAAFGAAAYFAAFSLATLSAFDSQRARTWLALLVAPMSITTLWLFFVQAFVLRAYCDYCLLSGAMTFILTTIVVIAKIIQRSID